MSEAEGASTTAPPPRLLPPPTASLRHPDAAAPTAPGAPARLAAGFVLDLGQLLALIDVHDELLVHSAADGTVLFANAAYCRTFGVRPEQFGTLRWHDQVPADALAEELSSHDALTAAQPSTLRTHRSITADRRERWHAWHIRAQFDPAGTRVGQLAIGRDVTEEHLASMELAGREALFRGLADSSPAAIFQIGADGRLRYVNDRWTELTGQDVADAVGTGWLQMISVADHTLIERAAEISIRDRALVRLTCRFHRRDSTEVHWLEVHSAPVLSGVGDVESWVGHAFDVTDARKVQRRLEHLATHDPLTGLANRALFTSRLQSAVATTMRSGRTLAVLFCDLDRFKEVNDEHGHGVGDLVLAAFAERVQACVRDSDLAARIGGDEFAVLCEDVDEAAAVSIAERLVASLGTPLHLTAPDGRELTARAGVSVGIALSTAGSIGVDDIDALLARADAAMYHAKASGRAGWYTDPGNRSDGDVWRQDAAVERDGPGEGHRPGFGHEHQHDGALARRRPTAEP